MLSVRVKAKRLASEAILFRLLRLGCWDASSKVGGCVASSLQFILSDLISAVLAIAAGGLAHPGSALHIASLHTH